MERITNPKTLWDVLGKVYYVDFADGCGLSTELFDSIDANRYEKANYFADEILSEKILPEHKPSSANCGAGVQSCVRR